MGSRPWPYVVVLHATVLPLLAEGFLPDTASISQGPLMIAGGAIVDLQPAAEIPGLDTRRPVPAHVDGPQELEPPQQVQAVRASRRRRPASRLQVLQIGGDRLDHYPVGVDQPVGPPRIVSADDTTGLRHDQARKIPR